MQTVNTIVQGLFKLKEEPDGPLMRVSHWEEPEDLLSSLPSIEDTMRQEALRAPMTFL